MPANKLTWFPPAPSSGAVSILQLPPDDWVLEPKYDGIRVLWYEGEAWTRHGTLLTRPKGAERIRKLLAGVNCAIDGEWIQDGDLFYAFDLPDQPGDYDARSRALDAYIEVVGRAGVIAVTRFPVGFTEAYDFLKGKAEGVVMKRRASVYAKQGRPGSKTRDWLKRRFAWDLSNEGNQN